MLDSVLLAGQVFSSPISVAQPAIPVTGPRANHIRAREHDPWRNSQL
jgi:hypothetical protein